jgi:Nuclease-related domain
MGRVMTLGTATNGTVRHVRGMKRFDPLTMVAAAATHLQNWAVVAEGRRRTRRVLQSLDSGPWQVTQNILLPDGGHADHLVIGPGGVFVLDSRAWQGVVTVDHKGATITPEGRPAAAWIARGQHCSLAPSAAALGRALPTSGGSRRHAPRAVVVVWAPFPEGLAISGGITYIAGDRLGDWMSDRPGRLAYDNLDSGDDGRPAPLLARALH